MMWVIGELGTVRHTTNHGKTWSSVDIGAKAVPKDNPYPVQGIGDRDLYMATVGGSVFHSRDAGKTWTRETVSKDGGGCCSDMEAQGDDVYVIGSGGNVFHSNVKAPGSWTPIPVQTGYPLQSVLSLSSGGVYVGGGGGAQGRSWKTLDMGKTWMENAQIPLVSGIEVLWSPLSDTRIYAAGLNGFIEYSPDGGKTWQEQMAEVQNSGQTIFSLWGSSPTDLYALFPPGYLHSSDGTTWKPQPNPSHTPNAWLETVWGSAADDVYMVGSLGVIVHYHR